MQDLFRRLGMAHTIFSKVRNLAPKARVLGADLNKILTIMEVAVIGVFIPIIATIGAFIMVIYLRKYANEERMAMIEKGMDPNAIGPRRTNTSGPLRASLLLIGAGLGLLMGYWLDNTFYMVEVGYFFMLFIFSGVGLGWS